MSMRSHPASVDPEQLRIAYRQLVNGSETLLNVHLFWTEQLFLRLVSWLYRRRLQQLSGLFAEIGGEDSTLAAREALLAAMAEAALGGHDLGEWELVDNGYQARCLQCSMTSWVGHDGVRYSLLEDECPVQA